MKTAGWIVNGINKDVSERSTLKKDIVMHACVIMELSKFSAGEGIHLFEGIGVLTKGNGFIACILVEKGPHIGMVAVAVSRKIL